MQELEKLVCRIYEDRILASYQMNAYAILDGCILKNRKDLSAEIADLEAELSGYEERSRISGSLLLWLINTKF